MIFELPERVNSFVLYNDVLKQINEYYLDGNKECPIISLKYTDMISSEALPILISIFQVLKIYHKRPIKLELIYKPKLLYFLEHSRFFYYASEKLQLIEYDKDLIGGFSNYIEKDYRDSHKLHVYYPEEGYYKLDDSEQIETRAKLYEVLAHYIIPSDFGDMFEDAKQLGDKDIYEYTVILAEIIANAKLYSGSLCYTMFQTNKFRTSISIADLGIGFGKALEAKKENGSYPQKNQFDISCSALKKTYTEKLYSDYFNIMSILYYSECQKRINLYYLRDLVVRNNGNVKIHSGTTQIIFTSNRCSDCRKSILECTGCLLENQKGDFKYLPVKVFNTKLSGVHIEIEFKRG